MFGLDPKIINRLENPLPFIEAIISRACHTMIDALKANTPGVKLPKEWAFKMRIAGNIATATVYHSRLEQDRDKWEVVFNSHNGGSEDHWIEPKDAQVLSWEEDGIRYFSRGHEVKGVTARYFAEAGETAITEFSRTIESAWKTWIETGRLP